jgi:hypothetical protein
MVSNQRINQKTIMKAFIFVTVILFPVTCLSQVIEKAFYENGYGELTIADDLLVYHTSRNAAIHVLSAQSMELIKSIDFPKPWEESVLAETLDCYDQSCKYEGRLYGLDIHGGRYILTGYEKEFFAVHDLVTGKTEWIKTALGKGGSNYTGFFVDASILILETAKPGKFSVYDRSSDKHTRILELGNRIPLKVFDKQQKLLSRSYSFAGKQLSADVVIYDFETMQPLKRLQGFEAKNYRFNAVLSPDEQYLLINDDSGFHLYQTGNYERIAFFSKPEFRCNDNSIFMSNDIIALDLGSWRWFWDWRKDQIVSKIQLTNRGFPQVDISGKSLFVNATRFVSTEIDFKEQQQIIRERHDSDTHSMLLKVDLENLEKDLDIPLLEAQNLIKYKHINRP